MASTTGSFISYKLFQDATYLINWCSAAQVMTNVGTGVAHCRYTRGSHLSRYRDHDDHLVTVLPTFFGCTMLAICPATMADGKTAIVGISATLVNACEAGSISGGNNSFGSLNFGALYSISSAVSIAGQQR